MMFLGGVGVRSSTGMMEIALFLALIGVCLTVAFTSYDYAKDSVQYMQEYKSDARQLRPVDSGGLSHAYLGRVGAYLDAQRLAFSAGAASADSRASIRIFGTKIAAYDMYTMNVNDIAVRGPLVYDSLVTWWTGFSTSAEYACSFGNSCLGPIACPEATAKTYIAKSDTQVRTYTPTHITADLADFEMDNPRSLDECKFRLRVVEVGKDPIDGSAILEYRVYIFLGSLAKSSALAVPQVEYRWYECVIGGTGIPWVILL